MQELSLTGRNTNILLKTMGEEKVVSSYIVSGLEVSSLHNNDFLELPDMYSHSDIPASVDNIPSQEYVNEWSYKLPFSRCLFPRLMQKLVFLLGLMHLKQSNPGRLLLVKMAVHML